MVPGVTELGSSNCLISSSLKIFKCQIKLIFMNIFWKIEIQIKVFYYIEKCWKIMSYTYEVAN